MTDRDKSLEGFLQRWSRKKTETERETPGAAAEAAESRAPLSEQDASPASSNAQTPSALAPQPEFDLTSLPSLDSITSTSDVRAFLMPGVPKELARAALRRAWSADPAIRDFVGLAENAWDFNDPKAMAGFGPLPPGFDVTKLVAELFGEGQPAQSVSEPVASSSNPQAPSALQETSSPTSANTDAPAPGTQEEVARSSPKPQVAVESSQADFVQRANNIATHNSGPDDETEEEHRTLRKHGGALPQ
jgi:hypothetical protein